MTRVEKYREYRKEILNSFYDDEVVTTKKQSSDLVHQVTANRDTVNNMSYDEVLEAYRIYDQGEENTKRKKKISKSQRNYRTFLIICVSIIVVLIVALIIVGIKAFGG